LNLTWQGKISISVGLAAPFFMKTSSIAAFVVVTIAVCLVSILSIEPLKPATPKAEAAAKPIKPHTQEPDLMATVWMAGANSEAPQIEPPPEQSWQEKLSVLIEGREDLFGPTGEENLNALRNFVVSIATSNLPVVFKEMQELQERNPTVFGEALQLHLLRQWAEKDIHSAAAQITQHPVTDNRAELIAVLASAWAAQNLADATAWAKQLPESAERHAALTRMADDVAFDHPIESLGLSLTETPQSLHDGTIRRAIASWTRQEPDNASSWTEQIADTTLREEGVSIVAETIGETAPTAAARIIINSMRPGELQNQTVLAVVRRWMQMDAVAAAAWINHFPDGTLRQNAMALLESSPRYYHGRTHRRTGEPGAD
jgi:chemotaxis protein histidine kinase CheA